MRDTLVIADSSCLIILSKIGRLEILKSLYQRVLVTKEIASECGEILPEWIEIGVVQDKTLQKLFEETLDLGESSALALAFEVDECVIILDDLKARRIAMRLDLSVTGTIGLIVKAKQKNVISSVRSVFKEIENTDFRISEKIINAAIKHAGE